MKQFITIGLALGIIFTNAFGSKALIRQLERLSVGQPISYRNLTIFPLSTKDYDRTTDYLTLDQAMRKGYMTITEQASAQVNHLWVENTSRSFVFLMSSELVAGCKQDRMVANDCLLGPQSGRIDLQVYCTEHGRWTSEGSNFKSLDAAAHLSMRQVAKESKSQQEVWDEVRSKAGALAVTPAPTMALKSVIGGKEVAERCQPYKDKLAGIPGLGRDVVGVAVACGDAIICIDVFANPSLFKSLWPKLLNSYVLDVVDRSSDRCHIGQRDVERALDAAAGADFQRGTTDGLGQSWEFRSGRASGSALLYRDRLVHCDIFPSPAQNIDDESTPRLDYRRGKVH